MGLIVFVFFFLVVLTILSINLIFKKEPYAKYLFMLSCSTVVTGVVFLTLLLALYFNFSKIIFITSKLFMLGMVISSFFIMQFTVKMPYFKNKTNPGFTIFNAVLHTGIAAISIFFIEGFFWNALSGFKFNSMMTL